MPCSRERCTSLELPIDGQIQSTLAISTSVISNNRLSRSEILVPVLTQKLYAALSLLVISKGTDILDSNARGILQSDCGKKQADQRLCNLHFNKVRLRMSCLTLFDRYEPFIDKINVAAKIRANCATHDRISPVMMRAIQVLPENMCTTL